jgi:hypothetical protein
VERDGEFILTLSRVPRNRWIPIGRSKINPALGEPVRILVPRICDQGPQLNACTIWSRPYINGPKVRIRSVTRSTGTESPPSDQTSTPMILSSLHWFTSDWSESDDVRSAHPNRYLSPNLGRRALDQWIRLIFFLQFIPTAAPPPTEHRGGPPWTERQLRSTVPNPLVSRVQNEIERVANMGGVLSQWFRLSPGLPATTLGLATVVMNWAPPRSPSELTIATQPLQGLGRSLSSAREAPIWRRAQPTMVRSPIRPHCPTVSSSLSINPSGGRGLG